MWKDNQMFLKSKIYLNHLSEKRTSIGVYKNILSFVLSLLACSYLSIMPGSANFEILKNKINKKNLLAEFLFK